MSEEAPLWLDALRYFAVAFAFFAPLPSFSQGGSSAVPPITAIFDGESIKLGCFKGTEGPTGNSETAQGNVCAFGVPNCKQFQNEVDSKLDLMYADWKKTAYDYSVHLDFKTATEYFSDQVPKPTKPGSALPGKMCINYQDGPNPPEVSTNRKGESCGENLIEIEYHGATVGLKPDGAGGTKRVGDIEQAWLNGFFALIFEEQIECVKKEMADTNRLRTTLGMGNLAKELEKLYKKIEKETTESSRVFLTGIDGAGGLEGVQSKCQQQNLLENTSELVEEYCSKDSNLVNQTDRDKAKKAARQMQSTCYLANASLHITQATALIASARAQIIADWIHTRLTKGYDSPFEVAVRNYVETFKGAAVRDAVIANLTYTLGVPTGYNRSGMERDTASNLTSGYQVGIANVVRQFYQDHLGKPCL